MFLAFGLLLPFVGTTLGAAAVLLLRGAIPRSLQQLLSGFASGVMIAAAVWSLLLPAIEMARAAGLPAWLPAAVGFLGGMLFLLLLDRSIPHRHLYARTSEGPAAKLDRTTKLLLAVTLHNIPEGMAVGVALAEALNGATGITAAGALILSLGIAIQNIPEGAIVSLPMHGSGHSRGRSFCYGVLSGAVEPLAGIGTVLLLERMRPLLPWLPPFAAGAMLYVVVEELIPESRNGRHADLATIGVALGFTLMMTMDVALG